MWADAVRNEKGVALPLALFALVMLSGLLLAFLTMGGMEPEIAANLGDVARARYVAETGVEWAFDQLVLNTNWNQILLGPDLASNTADDGLMGNNLTLPAPLNNAALGTFTAQVRNDNQAGDPALTGQPIDGGVVGGNPTTDTNGTVILTASGTYRGVTRQIQVVLRRVPLPPFQGAYSLAGVQADLRASASNNFSIDGRDYLCTVNCANTDFAQRTYDLNPSQANMKYGIATSATSNGGPANLPGIQQNTNPQITYEARAEQGLNTGGKQGAVVGKDQTNPAASTSGLNTVAQTPGVDTVVMQSFLTQLAQFSGTTVLQSTIACPMELRGSSGGGAYTNTPTLRNGCGIDQPLDLGTRQNPKLVYFRGELDPSSSFTGLRTRDNIQGAGILVIEDGDLRTTGNLNWDGVIIVTGRYVSTIFDSGSRTTVFGAVVSNETIWDEGGNSNSTPYYDAYFGANSTNLRYSKEALDLLQRGLLFRMSTWREL